MTRGFRRLSDLMTVKQSGSGNASKTYLENFIQRNDKKSLWIHRKMKKQKPKISRHPRIKRFERIKKACKHVRHFIITLYSEESIV